MLSLARLAHVALVRPRAAALALALATALLAAGLPRLATDVGYRAFLGERHPSVARFDAFLARFGGGLPLAAVWSCEESSACDSVFDEAALRMAADVAAALAASPAVTRVESPATATLLVPSALGVLPVRFVEDGRPLAADERAPLAARAVADPLWVRRLVSPDGRTGAVVAELVSSSSETSAAAYAALDEALAPWEREGFAFARVGGPVEFVVAGGELERATAELIPLMVALVGIVLIALFRSAAAAAVTLASVGVAVLWTFGLLGWLSAARFAQNTLTQTLAPLVLVIGVGDGMHVLARFAAERAAAPGAGRAGRHALLLRATRDVARPCLVTTLTTAAGFLSFATAPLESFARFGAIAAFGVVAALVLTFTLLPMLLLALPESWLGGDVRLAAYWERALAGWIRFSHRRAGAIAALALVAIAAGALGMTRLRVDASFEDLYGERSRVVRWARTVGEHLRRPDTLEVELALPPGAALEDPAVLRTIDGVARELASIDTLGPATSVADAVRFTHRLVRGDDPEAERIAESAEENDALLALASALTGAAGEDGLAPWRTRPDGGGDAGERVRARISLESEKTPQDRLRRVMERVRGLLANELPPGWTGLATGPLALVHDMIDAIRATQLRSFATAGVTVWLLVALAMRSAGAATLAAVPTLLPVVVTLGAMGAAGIALDVGSAMVAAVVLGIAVDDAVHLIEHYRRARAAGRDPDAAIADAVHHAGRAVVTTSVALALGFASLSLSPWQSVASFGLVASAAIVAALAAALGLLPALLVLASRVRRASPDEERTA